MHTRTGWLALAAAVLLACGCGGDSGRPDPGADAAADAAGDAPASDAPGSDAHAGDAGATDADPPDASGTDASCACKILGTCYAASAKNPKDACQRCDPTKKTSAWTTFAGKGCVTTLAGTGTAGYKNGPADKALFNGPWHVAVDSAGKVYVADVNNHCIRVVSGGQVTTLAGTGTAGYLDGAAATAQFNAPRGVAVGASGNVYVSDTGNHRIRLISGGKVTTVAGTGTAGFKDGAALGAQLNGPSGLAVDATGKVIIAGGAGHRVRELSGGTLSTLAGTGTAGSKDGPASTATFNTPQDVAVAGSTKVYVAGHDGHTIRLISGGQVTTLAGTGTQGFLDGTATSAQFDHPAGLAVNTSGDLFVGDEQNSRVRLLEGGKVTTAAGNGKPGFADGAVKKAQFNYPRGIAIDGAGKVHVGDHFNHRVRLITF